MYEKERDRGREIMRILVCICVWPYIYKHIQECRHAYMCILGSTQAHVILQV